MDHHSRVLVVISHSSPSIVVELLDLSHVIPPVCWLVEKLNGGNNIGLTGVSGGEITDRSDCVWDIVSRLPLNGTLFSTVVKASRS